MRTMEEQGSAVEPKVAWEPPADMDPECITLCAALNKLPGIQTFESCCGHKNDPKKNDMFKHNFWVFFLANSLESLLPVLYWVNHCHSGVGGWRVIAYTDCSMCPPPRFQLEGPSGPEGYEGANKIAKCIEKYVKDELRR